MKPRNVFIAAVLILTVAATWSPAQETKVPAVALERLRHHVGDWEIKTEYVDGDGKVVSTAYGTDTARWAIKDKVVEMTTKVPKIDYVGKAWMFYDPFDKRFYLTSVDSKGDLWILSGGLDEYVLTSQPKKRPDGREMTIRFTHKNIEADSFEAVMEFSYDGGDNWQMGFLQTITRQISGG